MKLYDKKPRKKAPQYETIYTVFKKTMYNGNVYGCELEEFRSIEKAAEYAKAQYELWTEKRANLNDVKSGMGVGKVEDGGRWHIVKEELPVIPKKKKKRRKDESEEGRGWKYNRDRDDEDERW